MTKPKKGRQNCGGKSKQDLERKRDERARKTALKKEREAKEYLENDENFVSFSNQLQAVGYKIKDIQGDGNCLFRALSDQLEGDDSGHLKHRRMVVRYLADHREEFEPFVEDNRTFDSHVAELGKAGTHGGHDSIVAFSRFYGVNIVIHQLNEPCWVVQGSQYAVSRSGSKELHISYHNGDHYSSVRRIGDPHDGPAWEYNNKHIKIKESQCQTNKEQYSTKKPSKTNQAEQSVHSEGAEAAVVQQPNDDIAIIRAATGCEDDEMITQTLVESSYDMDATISYILQLQSMTDVELSKEVPENMNIVSSSDLCDIPISQGPSNVAQSAQQENSTPHVQNKSKSNAQGNGARPKVKQQQHVSNAKRKQLAKQEKKARRMEERREEAHRNHTAQNEVGQHELEITGDLEALAI